MTETSPTSPPTHMDSKGTIPEEKYNLVKKRLKEMTEKNENLTNDLNHAKKRLRRLAHEKSILLDRICQYDDSVNISQEDDESILDNEFNENHYSSLTIIDTDVNNNRESTKKDLHVITEDETQQEQRYIPSLSETLHDHTTTMISMNNKNNKSPDIHPIDQIYTPHTPVPSTLRKDSTLPKLPSTILKHTAPHTLSNHMSSNGMTPFNNCNDYDSRQSSTSSVISSHSSSTGNSSSSTTPNLSSSSSILHDTNQSRHHHSALDSGKSCTMVPSSRPKRMRRGNQEPKMRRVQPLARDPSSGEYRLPARVGILTVHSLGRVIPLTTYHNDRYIWPPGFKVSRTYLSMVNSDQNTVYTCTVEENGEQGPRFRVIADDCPDQPIIANSATGVWTAIVKRANEIRNREHSNSASGPDYYGFTHATIAKMIQDLPGADQCLNYVWQKFGVMQQRTAAGVAAAAQKKLANLEIMGSANKRAPPPIGEGFVLNKDDTSTTTSTAKTITHASTSSTSVLKLKEEPPTNSLPPPSLSPSSSISPPSLLSNAHPQTTIATSSPITTTVSSSSSSSSSSPSLPSIPSSALHGHHQPLHHPSSSSTSSVLPSLATMTSTAAAAAAAVDIQQSLNNPSSSVLSSSSSSISPLPSTSLQHHSLHSSHHHRHPPVTTASPGISVWSTLSR
ncbi:F/Y rich C-terminus-domain-containing protein [Halteromyces radiatus]|uniref:F/Y rich C-terminus-domain-containing protein n=1 Tax=Halteromyces radiatus TaxID=101107 RepID=UPI00221F374A|nr:F/Y rich C-terminus-domain-containing protein [Halteromyces radiatus]KAI8097631.1 F/Y rich C-terminus-domain-containing protein [Halteromyces radiatus]